MGQKAETDVAGFSLSDEDVARLKADVGQNRRGKRLHVPNPHNKGFYFFLIEALKALGANRAHPAAVVTAKFRELTNRPETKDGDGQTFWRRWTKTVSDVGPWRERFERNVEVLQRVPRPGIKNNTPYGLRLLQVGTKVLGTRGVVIDILRDRDGLRKYRLNTDSDDPVNQFRQRRADSRRAKVDRFTSAARVSQRGKCAICLRDNRKLCLDHCHRRGHLRGLVCGKCNSGLGFFEDSIPSILRAALYLESTGKRESKIRKGPRAFMLLLSTKLVSVSSCSRHCQRICRRGVVILGFLDLCAAFDHSTLRNVLSGLYAVIAPARFNVSSPRSVS